MISWGGNNIIDENIKKSEEKNSKKTKILYNLNNAVPDVRSSFETEIRVLKAFVTSSDFGKKFVVAKEVAPLANASHQIVGGILSFFSKINFSTKEGYKYKPVQELINFVNELKYENEQIAGKALQPLIKKTWFGNFAFNIFQVEENPITKEELFKQIGKFAGADPEYHNSSIYIIIDYLIFSQILDYNTETNILNLKVEKQLDKKDETISKKNEEKQTYELKNKDEQKTIKKPEQIQQISKAGITININLNLDSTIDEEKFKKIIEIIKKNLKNE